ncbi:hypothetical protein TpMuguga_02g00526 [Theileria parva strain Muguga]|uniref:Uncharacterized protein n=1 Tax=Theileria parva TaxID=5875 RepID=Q4N4W4_THEPA|nr:uncharacterized protein TpMuguga_02g00526 [Theileria parva strain Muguga]EAN32809.1 hypothetical protein TpMuguga_02g00526 [Theileria parva strain Muguga]|eukprot:XP_765092.1 hypothetical protein [Theileria parva strain Muguga]
MATILDVNVNSDLCPQDSIDTFYSDTKNVESSESDYESVESDDSICISNDSDYNCDRSQTDQQKVTIAPVINTNFTTEEKELRGHLNSLYLQLLKKHYDKPFLPDGSSFHPVNDPIYGVQNTSISGNLLYLYDCIIRKRVELIIDTGKRRALSFEDKLLLTHEIKKAPEHLISQDEKDLLIKLINNRMDSTQIEKSSAVLKKYIYHFIVHYLNEKLVAFSEDNDGLKDCNEFEFFDRLITKQEHLEIQKKINQLALINMEKNLRTYESDTFRKHFSDFKHADLHEHVKNRLNEMYSVDLEQETNTDGQSMHNRITSKIPTYKKPQIDTHSVINTSVTPIDYSPEEQELRAKLDSVYHLVFKKFYDKGLIKNPSHFPPNFDDPLCDIRGLFVSELILKGSEEYIECSVVCVLYNIAKNLLNAEDKKRYVDELKNTPEHLIDQEEKDLIIKNYAECLLKSEPQLYRAEIEKLLLKIKAHIDDITINYLSERILGFSRDFNLKNGKEFEFFNNLITQKENFNVEDKIYYTILEIMEKKVLGSDEDIKILR